jgi:hypothetical protein
MERWWGSKFSRSGSAGRFLLQHDRAPSNPAQRACTRPSILRRDVADVVFVHATPGIVGSDRQLTSLLISLFLMNLAVSGRRPVDMRARPRRTTVPKKD